MTVVISLGMRLDVHMHTRLENGVLHNGQQPGSVENNFFDHSKFEAMNLLSGWEAVRSYVLLARSTVACSIHAMILYVLY